MSDPPTSLCLSMGSQMLSTGIHHILGLSRYQGTVRVGNEGGNNGSHAVSVVEGVSGMDGRVSCHKADGDLSLTFLDSVSSQMLGTCINYFLGLSGYQGTVRVGNEGGYNGSHAISEVGVSDVGVSGDQVDGKLSLTLLTSIHSSSRMYSKSSSIREVTSMSDLSRVMVCGGDGYVRVEGSHSTVRVGDQLGCAARNKKGGCDQELHDYTEL